MNLNTLEAALPNGTGTVQSTVTTEDLPPFIEDPQDEGFEEEFEEELVSVKYGPQHFELMKLLGEGAFGKVYLVHSRFQKTQYYAMKVLSKRLLKKKNNISYLKVERNVLIKLQQHPFLIHLFTAFQSRKYVYLVMNFLPGGELFLHLRKQGIIAERDVQFYLGELILGIEYIHSKGIIHRDIKPENLLLRQDGHICITDFGLG
jgi:p70 ribosomal S6 kinase